MKKDLFFSIASFLLIIALPGCKKAIDFIEDHPTAELEFCGIKKFSYLVPNEAPGQTDTLFFKYNALGDPIDVTRPVPGTGTEHLDYLFRYDKQNRLTDLIGKFDDFNTVSEGEIIEDWNRYFYDSHKRIILDSFYNFGTVVNGLPTKGEYGAIEIITYEYDKKDRMIKSTLNNGNQIFIDSFPYDEHGNIAGRTYDSKINMNRTNRIWMFLDRDYSVNNPFTADTYNVFELPLKVPVPMYFFSANALSADVEYFCSNPGINLKNKTGLGK